MELGGSGCVITSRIIVGGKDCFALGKVGCVTTSRIIVGGKDCFALVMLAA